MVGLILNGETCGDSNMPMFYPPNQLVAPTITGQISIPASATEFNSGPGISTFGATAGGTFVTSGDIAPAGALRMNSIKDSTGAHTLISESAGTSELGFFGAAAVVQPTAPTAPATTGSTQSTPFGYTTAAQADAISAAVAAICTLLHNLGLTT